jgi:hypothetical protein
VNADGKKIKKQTGILVADTDDPAVAAGHLTRTRSGAKKISGQPDLVTI